MNRNSIPERKRVAGLGRESQHRFAYMRAWRKVRDSIVTLTLIQTTV